MARVDSTCAAHRDDGRLIVRDETDARWLASCKYHTPFVVEWTPAGWARPDAGR